MRFSFFIRIFVFVPLLFCSFMPSLAYASAPQYLKDRFESGDAHAAYIIGNRYRLGVGGERNKALAKHWYEKAANGGVIEGQLALAWMYKRSGTDKSYQEALKWLLIAQANTKNTNTAQQEAFEKVNEYLLEFCEKGYVDFPVGHAFADDPKCWLARGQRMYKIRGKAEDGGSIFNYSKPTDYSRRIKDYFIRALDAGELSAAETLAHIETKGWGGPKSLEKAQQYLELAQNELSGAGHFKVALMSRDGDDINKYLRHLKIGAQAGGERAARQLGHEYLNAEHVSKDDRLGFMYLMLGRSRYPFKFTGKKTRTLDAYFPVITSPSEVLVLFREKATLQIMEVAYQDALTFAKKQSFDEDDIADVSETYDYAVASYNYYHPRGAIWYTSEYWRMMFFRLMPLLFMSIFGFVIWLLLRKNGARLNWWNW